MASCFLAPGVLHDRVLGDAVAADGAALHAAPLAAAPEIVEIVAGRIDRAALIPA